MTARFAERCLFQHSLLIFHAASRSIIMSYIDYYDGQIPTCLWRYVIQLVTQY